MIAEIIAIGDELASGQRLDTNSQWLSRALADIGVTVHFHTTVRDDIAENIEVIRVAARRADVVICTGGLGPTADDLTREAIAQAAGVELEFRQPVLDHIAGLYQSRGRAMPERNRVQAMFPAGANVIPNPHGTAPGVDYTFRTENETPCRLFALPGVPAEMTEMWEETVGPAIFDMTGGSQRVIVHRALKCFGVGESRLEEMLPDLIARGRTPTVGITVSRATITLRIRAEDESDDACRLQIGPTEATIRQTLGDLVFGEEAEELQDVIVRQLADRGETVATLEWETAGMMAGWLAEACPSGDCFQGGLICRSLTSVYRNLGWQPPIDDDEHTPDADEVTRWAKRLREHLGVDWAIVIGPPMNPQGDRPDREVFIAVDGPSPAPTQKCALIGHPDIIHARTVKIAFNTLRLRLAKLNTAEA
ncbi:MAG: CinA family nicotinamide mononucleotide deamidase-related protein [bacterium]|nr:CinA family nicotinamide mononucleotide deamidase-related protein [bacterium]